MKLNRRAFIKMIPALALAVAGGAWWFLSRRSSEPIMTSRATVTSSVPPQGTSTTLKAFDFPVTWNGDQPIMVNPNDYRLKVDGDVPRPLELTLEDLYAMSKVQKTLKIQCVEGWAADVPWEGVPVSYLLIRAGASLKNVAIVIIDGITGYQTVLSSAEVAKPDNMIALKAGGVPLPVDHGYPARLVLPARPGLDWVKYVGRITCRSR